MTGKLAEKVALITGASAGIGEAAGSGVIAATGMTTVGMVGGGAGFGAAAGSCFNQQNTVISSETVKF